MWISVVNYFTDSSKIVAVYGIITLLIIKESFDNQIVDCQIGKDDIIKFDVNAYCTNRVLFNSSLGITSNDYNYFKVAYVYGFHLMILLGTTALSPHLLPFIFYYLHTKTGNYFEGWNKLNLNSI